MRNTLRSAPLTDLLNHELERGNTVAAEETAWSRMDLVVRMNRPLDEKAAAKAAASTPGLRVFRTTDPHYGGSEFGVQDGTEAIVAKSSQ